jgi:cell division protein FtsB
MTDQAKLQDELARLDSSRQELDREIRDAQDRQRYGTNADEIEAAKREERDKVVAMDRLMTRIRAVEGQLLMAGKAGAEPSHFA